MTGPKLNERPGTRAVLRNCRSSAYKVRVVLDLVRGKDVAGARDILQFCERDAATVVGKLLDSAVANAEHNDGMDPEELYVSACFADEGATMKRWRPRARGRVTRIRKRTCHITVVVSRLPDARLAQARARRTADSNARRSRRVAGGQQGRPTRRDERPPATTAAVPVEAPTPVTEPATEPVTEPATDEVVEPTGEVEQPTEAPTTAERQPEQEGR
ncbi:MAG: 50S ribosomal protein L22 [Acidimicrobiales bacterium]